MNLRARQLILDMALDLGYLPRAEVDSLSESPALRSAKDAAAVLRIVERAGSLSRLELRRFSEALKIYSRRCNVRGCLHIWSELREEPGGSYECPECAEIHVVTNYADPAAFGRVGGEPATNGGQDFNEQAESAATLALRPVSEQPTDELAVVVHSHVAPSPARRWVRRSTLVAVGLVLGIVSVSVYHFAVEPLDALAATVIPGLDSREPIDDAGHAEANARAGELVRELEERLQGRTSELEELTQLLEQANSRDESDSVTATPISGYDAVTRWLGGLLLVGAEGQRPIQGALASFPVFDTTGLRELGDRRESYEALRELVENVSEKLGAGDPWSSNYEAHLELARALKQSTVDRAVVEILEQRVASAIREAWARTLAPCAGADPGDVLSTFGEPANVQATNEFLSRLYESSGRDLNHPVFANLARDLATALDGFTVILGTSPDDFRIQVYPVTNLQWCFSVCDGLLDGRQQTDHLVSTHIERGEWLGACALRPRAMRSVRDRMQHYLGRYERAFVPYKLHSELLASRLVAVGMPGAVEPDAPQLWPLPWDGKDTSFVWDELVTVGDVEANFEWARRGDATGSNWRGFFRLAFRK